MIVKYASMILMTLVLGLPACRPQAKADGANEDQPSVTPAVGAVESEEAAGVQVEAAGSTSGPKIECAEPVKDFGDFWVGAAPIPHTFEFRNVGDEVLKVEKIKTSCGCTQAGNYSREVGPGETGMVPIRLDTQKMRSKFSRTVTLTLNDPEHPTYEFKLVGDPKRYIDITPPSASFGQVDQNDPLKKTLTIRNNSDRSMELDLVPETDDSWGPFAVTLAEREPGKVYELEVEGLPPYAMDLNEGKVKIKTNFPEDPELKITVVADVPPRIRIRPREVKASEQTRSHRVMFTNRGEAPVNVLSATASDSNVKVSVKEVYAGELYQINITTPAHYQPPTEGSYVTIVSDDAEYAETVITILPPQ